jgi:hypothetical protein
MLKMCKLHFTDPNYSYAAHHCRWQTQSRNKRRVLSVIQQSRIVCSVARASNLSTDFVIAFPMWQHVGVMQEQILSKMLEQSAAQRTAATGGI